MAYYLAPISTGLGDLIVSLPALQALIQTGTPTFLISRTPFHEGLESRIPGLAGLIRETAFNPDVLSEDDVFFNLRNHPLQTDYIWGSENFEKTYPGYKITDVMKGICADFGIAANYDDLKPLPFEKNSECDDAVVFVPGSAGIVKCWPSSHWIDLASRLGKCGHKVVVIGQPERSVIVKDCLESGLPHLPTETMIDALDALSSALCVVAVDTGLMHLAVHQKVLTVALFRYNVMFKRDYPHVRSLSAPLCHQACIDIEYSSVPNKVIKFDAFVENKEKLYWETWTCSKENWSQRCMASIQPEHVQSAVDDLISISLAGR